MSDKDFLVITPHVSLFHKLGRVRFQLNTALPELVDNCIDGWHPNLPALVVQIRLDREKRIIEVLDNSDGFDIQDLGYALTIGYSPDGNSRIGENGFGLKAAATFLGNNLEIITRRHGSNSVYRVRYDREEFVRAGEWRLPFEILEPRDMPQPGTKIVISNLNVNLGAIEDKSVMEYLARIYRTYLETGKLTLFVNKAKVEPVSRPRLDKPFWKIDFEIQGGGKVRGWVGARDPKHAPTGDRGGFDLFRRGRMVRPGEWVGYQWTARLRHMVGELHLDGFDVNNNKTDFIRDTPEWLEFERKFIETLDGYKVRKYVYEATQKKASTGGSTPSGGGGTPSFGSKPSGGTPPGSGSTPSGSGRTPSGSGGTPSGSGGTPSGSGGTPSGSGGTPSGSGGTPGGGGGVLPGSGTSSGTGGKRSTGGTPDGQRKKPQRWHLPRKDKLALTDLHPQIRVGCERLFVQGHIYQAVREAFDIVNRHVREKVGTADDNGVDMMRQIFTPDAPKPGRVPAQLRFNDLSSKGERDEQEGFMQIFAGAQQGLRNPMAHGRVQYRVDEAIEYLAFASLLCRKVDKASLHKL